MAHGTASHVGRIASANKGPERVDLRRCKRQGQPAVTAADFGALACALAQRGLAVHEGQRAAQGSGCYRTAPRVDAELANVARHELAHAVSTLEPRTASGVARRIATELRFRCRCRCC